MSIIKIVNGNTRHPLHRMKSPINFSLESGEHMAILGPNGGGKSELVNTIIGKYPLLMNQVEYDFSPRTSTMAYDNIRYMAFRDTYGDTAEGSYYYQQRWNSQDADIYPTVAEATRAALTEADKEDFIYVGGSSFIVADLLSDWHDIKSE